MLPNDTQPSLKVGSQVKLTIAQILTYAGGLITATWYLSYRLAGIEGHLAVLEAVLKAKGIIP